MPQDLKKVEGWQALTDQDLADFEKASQTLREQLSRTEARLSSRCGCALRCGSLKPGWKPSQVDMDLLDRLSQTDSCDRKESHHDTSDCFGDHQ